MLQEFSDSSLLTAKTTCLRDFIEQSNHTISPNMLAKAGYPRETLSYDEIPLFDYNYVAEKEKRSFRLRDAMLWCASQFGDNFTTNGDDFWFDNEEDAVMFKLFWG